MAVYVISDIHGEYDKFKELLDGIKPEKFHTRKKGETYEFCDSRRHTRYL